MDKKTVLIHSNFCKMFTGFGKHKKNLLSYLYKTGKYNIIEFSNGFRWSEDSIKYVPWESYGSLPDDAELLNEIQKDPARAGAAGYGAETIDDAIYKFKPDIYLGIEDIWAFNGFVDKPWWNKINCVIHTTLDSLPILPDAVRNADKIKNYLVWATFAEKALHDHGHKHIKTVHGTLDTNSFFKIPAEAKKKLRNIFGLQDNFIVGFVFRNQLRKSVPNLLDGFKLFDQKNPQAKAKLLLHSHWSEGWDIPRLINEKGIDPNKVLATYLCHHCNNYHVRPFIGQGSKCPHCHAERSCETVNIKNGVNEQQLNEIYNLMDVYCHPFTSGGQEIPVQEAKLTELITLVTNYSCGEDSCNEASGGLPLDWAEYREPGTQFIKASTSATSICDKLSQVFHAPADLRNEMGQRARQYVIDHYGIEVVGKFFEDLFDSLPKTEYDFNRKDSARNPFYTPNENLNDKEWVESLYDNILGKKDANGVIHWISRLQSDLGRADVLAYFKKVAFLESQKDSLEQLFDDVSQDKNQKRLAVIQPESNEEVVSCAAILPSLKKTYPDHHIYFFTKPEYFDLINADPNIYKVLTFLPKMADPLFLEGKGSFTKYFDIVYSPFLSIRNNYFHNGEDIIQYQIHESN